MRRAVSVLVVIGFVSISSAVGEGRTISLEEARAIALSKTYLTEEVDAAYATNLAEALELRQLPNPEAEVSAGVQVAGDTSDASVPVGITLSQPLRLSHFGERQSVASLIEKASDADKKIALFELSQKVSLLYVRVWAFQEKIALLRGARARAAKQAGAIAEGAKKGVLSPGDERLFTAEEKKLSAQLIGVEAGFENAARDLVRQLGAPLHEVKVVRPSFPGRLDPERVIQSSNESSLSKESRAILSASLAEGQTRLARRDSFPVFSPKLYYERSDDKKEFVGLGVSFELPVNSRNEPQIRRAEAEASAARALSSYLKGAGYKEELMRLTRQVNALSEEADKYEHDVIPAYKSALDFQDRQFGEGVGSVLQLWQTQRELTEARIAMLELLLEAFAARIELSTLTGTEL